MENDKKIIVWALFDSGNGCYSKAAQSFPQFEVYPIGVDIERKNRHFIEMNLADFSAVFGKNKLFEQLDKLPKPDVILASPPCESFSVASAMWGGNACWKQEHRKGSRFTHHTYQGLEIYHALKTAQAVVIAMLNRKQSVGAHFWVDSETEQAVAK